MVQRDFREIVDSLSERLDRRLEAMSARSVEVDLSAQRERSETLQSLAERERVLAEKQGSLLENWLVNWRVECDTHKSRLAMLNEEASKMEDELEHCRKYRREQSLGSSLEAMRSVQIAFQNTVEELKGGRKTLITRREPLTARNDQPYGDVITLIYNQFISMGSFGEHLSAQDFEAIGSFEEVANALSVLCAVPVTPYVTTMHHFLSSIQPSIACGSALICWLFEGREAEFGDLVMLNKLGRPNLFLPQTWIAAKAHGDLFYFSALSCLSQREPPQFECESIALHVPFACSSIVPSSCCDPNPLPEQSIAGHRSLASAHVSAHFIKNEPWMLSRVSTLLKSYAYRELELLELLESRRCV